MPTTTSTDCHRSEAPTGGLDCDLAAAFNQDAAAFPHLVGTRGGVLIERASNGHEIFRLSLLDSECCMPKTVDYEHRRTRQQFFTSLIRPA